MPKHEPDTQEKIAGGLRQVIPFCRPTMNTEVMNKRLAAILAKPEGCERRDEGFLGDCRLDRGDLGADAAHFARVRIR